MERNKLKVVFLGTSDHPRPEVSVVLSFTFNMNFFNNPGINDKNLRSLSSRLHSSPKINRYLIISQK